MLDSTNENKQIVVEDVVSKLQQFAHLYGIRSIFIVGGYCRESYFDKLWRVNDIDVASAYHEQAIQLGGLFASEVVHSVPIFYHKTGTAMVEYISDVGSIKVEFQGESTNRYMYNEDVRNWMRDNKIDDTPLMNNIYGRDFTLNSLIYSLYTQKTYDPTGLAVKDIERKSVISLLPAEMLIRYNPIASLRAVRFALQYDFYINHDLRTAIRDTGVENLRSSLSEERIIQEVVRILKIDGEQGLELMKKMGLDKILLHTKIQNYIDLRGNKDADS